MQLDTVQLDTVQPDTVRSHRTSPSSVSVATAQPPGFAGSVVRSAPTTPSTSTSGASTGRPWVSDTASTSAATSPA